MIEMTKPFVPAFAKFAERISVPFSPSYAPVLDLRLGMAPIDPEPAATIFCRSTSRRARLGASEELSRAAGSGLDRS